MVRKSKKGFTIVELVIVIAVIGILTAVLVPTFVNLVNKANQAADDSLVKNLNTQLRMKEQTEGKNRNLTEALEDAKEAGYLVENLTPKGSRDIVWNQDKDEFGFGDEAKGDLYKYWFIAKSEADLSKTFSKYLYFTPTSPIVVSTGVDVGTHENVDVSYVHSGTPAQKVVIRTNGGTLTINALNDTVTHYGNANVVDVKAVASQSYHEYGTSTFIKVDTGRVVVNDEAEVGGLYVESNDAIIAVESTAELPTVYYSDGVDSFKVQTTDGEGEKMTESDVTISGETVTTEASEGEQPVPVDVRVKIERSEQKTEEEAGEAAAEVVPPAGVARIGTTGYASFKEAVVAAQPGQKIYLLKDCEISESIGELAQNGPNMGQIVNGLANEVLLADNVALTFVGNAQINLMEGGLFNVNEHVLRLSATTTNAGLIYTDIDAALLTLLDDSVYYVDIDVNIAYGGSNDGNSVLFNGKKWVNSQVFTGGANPALGIPCFRSNDPFYFHEEEIPGYPESNKLYNSGQLDDDFRPVWFNAGAVDPMSMSMDPNSPMALMFGGEPRTFNWTVKKTAGNLNVRLVGVSDADLQAEIESDPTFAFKFKGVTEGMSTSEKLSTVKSDITSQIGQYPSSKFVHFLNGTGAIDITVTNAANASETYTWKVVVY